jgi:hypothetical protein
MIVFSERDIPTPQKLHGILPCSRTHLALEKDSGAPTGPAARGGRIIAIPEVGCTIGTAALNRSPAIRILVPLWIDFASRAGTDSSGTSGGPPHSSQKSPSKCIPALGAVSSPILSAIPVVISFARTTVPSGEGKCDSVPNGKFAANRWRADPLSAQFGGLASILLQGRIIFLP